MKQERHVYRNYLTIGAARHTKVTGEIVLDVYKVWVISRGTQQPKRSPRDCCRARTAMRRADEHELTDWVHGSGFRV